MAGHSKWANIKHRKAAKDKKLSKVFSKHSKLIMIAAKEGGSDIETNSHLRMLIQKAKKDNVPSDKIEHAIKKGSGELDDGVIMIESLFEGYAPGGVAILIETACDNNNRVTSSIRHILSKNGGSLGTNGCVSYLFDRKGVFIFPIDQQEAIEEFAIMNGADDIETEADHVIVLTSVREYSPFTKALAEAGFIPDEMELKYIPQTTVKVEEKHQAAVEKILDLLEDDDDIEAVHMNGM